MLLTAEVVRALGLPDVRWRPIRIGPVGSTAMALLGIAALVFPVAVADPIGSLRSEEHTSELQSLMRISYAVFCLKKKKNNKKKYKQNQHITKTAACVTE